MLRNWRISGSAGYRLGKKSEWITLKLHENDESLAMEPGSTHTWELNDVDGKFNKFRLKIVGENANNHFYLATSGFEIYGKVFEMVPKKVVPTIPENMKDLTSMVFEYEYDFDENGLIFYLGTYANTKNFKNPGISGIVGVSSSGLEKDSKRIGYFIGRESVRCVTTQKEWSDMELDLKDIRFNVTHYTLRHYSSFDGEALRSWNLEGSNDRETWSIVSQHVMDLSLNQKGATKTWKVNHAGYFRYFRIIATGLNSSGHWRLACSGNECIIYYIL